MVDASATHAIANKCAVHVNARIELIIHLIL